MTDWISSQQFSTFLLASESFHKLQRNLFDIAADSPIKGDKVTEEFDDKLDEFIEKTWYTNPTESVDAILRKLEDLASDLESRKASLVAQIVKRCCINIRDIHNSNTWNVHAHLEELHRIARFWTEKFFAYDPRLFSELPDIKFVVEFLPNGGPLPLMSYANDGTIKVKFKFKRSHGDSMSFHQWHLSCPLMFLHEYTSHIAVRFSTFRPFDDGWMFHAICRFLRLAVADDPENPNLSEFQGKAAELFPLATINDQDAKSCAETAEDFAAFLLAQNKPNLFFPVTLRMYADAVNAGDDEAVKERMRFFMVRLRKKTRDRRFRQELLRAINQGVDDFIRFLDAPL